MDQNLSELIQRKQKPMASGGGIDWDDRKNNYLASVQGLYQQIAAILAEPIAQKRATLQRRPKQLTENYIGTYSVDDLILLIGEEQVRFSPRGRNIVGSTGRVDVVGDRGEATLIVQSNSKWGFVQNRQPKLQVVPLDESTLTEVLQIVMQD